MSPADFGPLLIVGCFAVIGVLTAAVLWLDAKVDRLRNRNRQLSEALQARIRADDMTALIDVTRPDTRWLALNCDTRTVDQMFFGLLDANQEDPR